MARIHDLPTEILLMVVANLVLKSLISGRGVCRLWRDLIREDCNSISPTRRRLLKLYLELVNARKGTFFPYTRRHIIPHLKDFDRAAYVEQLPKATPAEFVTWLLEWPAQAALEWIWPGLPDRLPRDSHRTPFWREVARHGCCKLEEPVILDMVVEANSGSTRVTERGRQ